MMKRKKIIKVKVFTLRVKFKYISKSKENLIIIKLINYFFIKKCNFNYYF